MRQSPVFATGMLTTVTLLWGLSFPLVKNWQDAAADCPGGKLVASLTLIAIRMVAALAFLAIFRPRLLFRPTRREHQMGALIGLVFFAGFALQVFGLAWTTPARSAFITSLGGAWVPLLIYLWFRVSVPKVTLLGLAFGVGGAMTLALAGGAGDGLLLGDALTLVSSVVFALQIILLDRLGRTGNSAHFTAAFFGMSAAPALMLATVAAAAGPGIAPWFEWTASRFQDPAIVRDLTLLILLATVLAFLWMNTYQPRVSAARAALIYFLEPIFSAIFSVLLGLEGLTLGLVMGGSLILFGNVLVELPRVLNQQATESC